MLVRLPVFALLVTEFATVELVEDDRLVVNRLEVNRLVVNRLEVNRLVIGRLEVNKLVVDTLVVNRFVADRLVVDCAVFNAVVFGLVENDDPELVITEILVLLITTDTEDPEETVELEAGIIAVVTGNDEEMKFIDAVEPVNVENWNDEVIYELEEDDEVIYELEEDDEVIYELEEVAEGVDDSAGELMRVLLDTEVL